MESHTPDVKSIFCEALERPADHGQRILVYTAEPASPSDDALKLLATWSATTPLTEPHADAAH